MIDLKNLVGDFLGFNAIILQQQIEINDLSNDLKILKEKFDSVLNDDISDKAKIAQLESALSLYYESDDEKYWNSKYPKIDAFYSREETDGNYGVDVRNFFQPYDSKIPVVSGSSYDDKATNALKWVKSNVSYVSDKTVYGYDEYWAYAYQTLKRRKGDCEDGAILMANIMLRSGIPYWRIRLNAGNVKDGGHAYVTYCREIDNQFVVLDWCYYYKDILMKDRKLHSEEQNYDDEAKNYGIWFSWNLKYSFGKMQTMSGAPDYLITKEF